MLNKKMVNELVKAGRYTKKIIGTEVYAEDTHANVYVQDDGCSFREIIITEDNIMNPKYEVGCAIIKVNYLLFGFDKWFNSTLVINIDDYNRIVKGAN